MPPSRTPASTRPQAVQNRQRRQTAKQENEQPQILMEATVEISEVPLASHRPPIKILLYGPPGVGKTRLAGGAPNGVFLSTEIEGAVSAKVAGSKARLWPAPTWPHAVAGILKARKELTEDDWLIVDSGTNMQEMYMRWILETIHAKNPQRDLDIPAIKDHQKYQNGFKRWVNSIIDAPCNVIFICNSMNAEDAEGEPRVIPLLLGKKGEISDYISAQFGVALYYSVARESREEEAIGPDIIRRVLAQPYPPWFAKDRYDALGSYRDVGYREDTAMATMIDDLQKARKEIGNLPDRTSRPGRPKRRVASQSRR
jgi:hypothetical protein